MTEKSQSDVCGQEPRNAGCLQKLEKARDGFSP